MDLGEVMSNPQHPAHPLVRRIVDDLRRDYALWRDKVRAFELATVNSTAGEPGAAALELEAELRTLAVDIESYVAEMHYLGVEFDVQRLMEKEP